MNPRITALVVVLPALVAACTSTKDPTGDTSLDTIFDTLDGDTAIDPADMMDAPEGVDITDPADDDGYTDTIGMICSTDEECQNGLYCDGVEICPYGFCQHGPRVDCDDSRNCTLDTCNEDTDSCEHEVDDAACDDSNPCTTDTCEVSTDTCANTPIDCSDTVTCTIDTCDTTTGDCEHTIADEACDDLDDCTIDTCDVPTDTCDNELIDGDGDLHPPESCGGDDCDDTDATIYTGAPEICEDGIDQDCDGADQPPGACDCPIIVSVPSSTPGDTTGMSSVYDGSCGFSTGSPEVAHRLELTSDMYLRFDTSGSGLMIPVLFIREGFCTGPEVGCHWDLMGVPFLDIDLRAGTYYVFVEGFDVMDIGPTMLNIHEMTPPTPVTGNDDCPSAYTITADGTFTGSLLPLTNQGSGTCMLSLGGRDAWFTFTLGSPARVHLDTFGTAHDTILYVRQGSCTGTEVGCNDNFGLGFTSALDLSLTADTYWAIVDENPVGPVGVDYILTVTGLP